MNASLNNFGYEVVQEWNGGFKGAISFTPGEESVRDWRIEFGADFEIQGIWHAQIVDRETNRYVLAPENENRRYNPGKEHRVVFTANTSSSNESEVDNLTFYDSAEDISNTASETLTADTNDGAGSDAQIDLNYTVLETWAGGFKSEFLYTPEGDSVRDWRLEMDGSFDIRGIWGAVEVSNDGDRIVLEADNDGEFQPGQTYNITIVADTEPGETSTVNNVAFYDGDGEMLDIVGMESPNPVTPPETPAPDTNNDADAQIDLNYTVLETWAGGFKSEFLYTPEGDSVRDWRLEMDGSFDIRGIWGAAEVSNNGDRIVLEANNDGEFQPGQTYNITIVADTEPGETSTVNNIAFYDGNGAMVDIVEIESPNLVTPPETPDSPINPPNDNTGGETNYGSGQFRYGEAVQKSFLFYEAQRSGDLPSDNRIQWRGDSALGDGSDVGLDLTGGYYDAGDHVKFGMPMAYSMTTLSWGGIEYKSAYKQMGQWDELKDAVKWGTDWILKAHINDGGQTQRVYVQVGDGYLDHSVWAPAETMTMDRPSLYIDANNPGSDIASDYAAALASASILFRGEDDNYSNRLLNEAKQLYSFAENNVAKYSDSVAGVNPFYTSWSSYGDELVWGANWLYKATGEQQYLDKAKQYGDQFRIHPGSGTISWDDKTAGSAIMLAQTGEARYVDIARQWLDGWMPGGGSADYTNGGFAWRSRWGSLRTTASTAFLAGVYHDTIEQNSQYHDFAQSQIDYILGDNPRNSSYVVGFGDNPPERVHHRSASGAKFNNVNFKSTDPNQHILYGALAGGPQSADDWDWVDDRGDAVGNEVALDYNAGYTGALAYMYDKYGGDALTDAELDLLPEIDVV